MGLERFQQGELLRNQDSISPYEPLLLTDDSPVVLCQWGGDKVDPTPRYPIGHPSITGGPAQERSWQNKVQVSELVPEITFF